MEFSKGEKMNVRESQIEDILATYPTIFCETVGLKEDASLIFRQYPLSSGRLDLLFAIADKLVLVELKVDPFEDEFIEQLQKYIKDLKDLQQRNLLLEAPIEPYLLCPVISQSQTNNCQDNGIIAVQYSPDKVLAAFFQRLRSIATFITIKPSDHGLWSIHLINKAVYSLTSRSEISSIAIYLDKSPKTVSNQLRFAEELCLVRSVKSRYYLTELGNKFIAAKDKAYPDDYLSEEQATVIRDFIVKDPFKTSTIFGTYVMVEAVFTLARNHYPVPLESLYEYFRDTCGKRFEWLTRKSLLHGTRMYSNYAIELGLLGKFENKLFLTPEGLRFILLLQLHKGIQVVDAVTMPQ